MYKCICISHIGYRKSIEGAAGDIGGDINFELVHWPAIARIISLFQSIPSLPILAYSQPKAVRVYNKMPQMPKNTESTYAHIQQFST